MASIDVRSAFYHIPVNADHQKYLKFQWQGITYKFVALVMGLTSSPRIYTKVMKPVFSTLRNKGYLSSSYIDDSYLQGQNYTECVSNIRDTLFMMLKLGFTIHPEKSVFVPTQILEFLGFILNSINMTVRLTKEKAQIIKKKCTALKGDKKCTIRDVAKVIGSLVSTCPGVTYGPLFYRQLENEK